MERGWMKYIPVLLDIILWIGDSITGSGSIVMALLIIIHPYYSETGKTLHVRNILLISFQKKAVQFISGNKGA
jgi:hypothetical protein